MEKYRRLLIVIPPLLIFLALCVTVYELNKPDFQIEHSGIVVELEKTNRGTLVLFNDGYVMLLEHEPDILGEYRVIRQGRSGFIYYEEVSGVSSGRYYIGQGQNYTDWNITDITPLFTGE